MFFPEGGGGQTIVNECLLGGGDATSGLKTDPLSAFLMLPTDGVEHDMRGLGSGRDGDFACGGLDEVGPGLDGEFGSPGDEGGGGEFTRFEDDLEGAFAAALADGGHFVAHALFIAFNQGSAADDHVYLVGAFVEGIPHLGQLDMQGRLTCRESPCHGCHADTTPLQETPRLPHKEGIDTHGGDGSYATRGIHHLERAVAEVLHAGDSVASFEGSIVDTGKETPQGFAVIGREGGL